MRYIIIPIAIILYIWWSYKSVKEIIQYNRPWYNESDSTSTWRVLTAIGLFIVLALFSILNW